MLKRLDAEDLRRRRRLVSEELVVLAGLAERLLVELISALPEPVIWQLVVDRRAGSRLARFEALVVKRLIHARAKVV